MNRKFESILMKLAGIWEVSCGLITIFYYGSYIKLNTLNIDINQLDNIATSDSIISNIYILVTTIGIISMFIGFINLYLSSKLKKLQVETKKFIWLISCSILSYLFMDILGGFLLLIAGIIMVSKNKAVKQMIGGNI